MADTMWKILTPRLVSSKEGLGAAPGALTETIHGEELMHSKFTAGILAGLIAGVVFGVMMSIMTAPTPDGMKMPMMSMVAKVVRSDSLAVGWTYHLFNSAVIGLIFGLLLGSRVHGIGGGIGWGALYGFVWWILGGLILMPILLGMPAFAPLQMPMMRPVAMGSLIGHLLFGIILGGGFAVLLRGRQVSAYA